MSRSSCPCRRSPDLRASLIALVLLSALVAACGTQVAPTGSPGSNASGGPTGSAGASRLGPSATATSPAGPNQSGPAGGTPTPSPDALASPPPVGDPQDDEACLAVVPRDDVGTALGTTVGDIVALGTDPAVSLTCTYTTDSGSLVVSTTAGDPGTGFQSSLDLANSYGQNPVAIDGLGDQAFYAIAADRWPEQVVFVKGPVLVRLINQTSATVGEVGFAALAATAAESIRAEIPPAP